MLHQISWTTYWSTIAIVLVFYYLIVFLKYFYFRTRSLNQMAAYPSFKNGYQGNEELTGLSNTQSIEGHDNDVQILKDAAPLIVRSFIDELEAFFQASRKGSCSKQDLIISLQSIALKYPSLHQSEYQSVLNNLMVSESEHICQVKLKESDMAEVWMV